MSITFRFYTDTLQVLLEAGEDLVTIEEVEGEDGDPDLRIALDRSKIFPVGKPAIQTFLQKLQVLTLGLE